MRNSIRSLVRRFGKGAWDPQSFLYCIRTKSEAQEKICSSATDRKQYRNFTAKKLVRTNEKRRFLPIIICGRTNHNKN